jgi:hypothetical protein
MRSKYLRLYSAWIKPITHLAAVILSVSLLATTSRSVDLTGAWIFSCDATGQRSGAPAWDTVPGDGVFNIWIASGLPEKGGLTNLFLNGPDEQSGSPNLTLHSGTNHFTLFATALSGTTLDHAALNLFLNGHVAPDISVFAPPRTSAAVPAFQVNNASATPNLNGSFVPASGKTNFIDGLFTVTLTEFSFAMPSLYQIDRVNAIATTSDQLLDFVGTLTLVVSPPSERLSIRSSQVAVSWFAQTNVMYQVYYRSLVTTNKWTPLGDLVRGTGDYQQFFDNLGPGEPQKFYQVLRVGN